MTESGSSMLGVPLPSFFARSALTSLLARNGRRHETRIPLVMFTRSDHVQ